MTGSFDPAWEEWKDRAREADILETARGLGAQLRKAGVEWMGPCPKCGGDDRFGVNVRDRVFICRGAGAGGAGDVIAMVEHVQDCSFVAACEILTGEPPPRGRSEQADPEIARERRQERRDQEQIRADQEAARRARGAQDAESFFADGREIWGTWAEEYLEGRSIQLRPEQAVDLRFIPNLDYFGFRDSSSKESEPLCTAHCMIAAIRDRDMRIIGVHRTYLDKQNPIKLRPPGDRKRNKAKKVFKNAKGGLIWLGPVSERVVIGEGIETTLAWSRLPYEVAEFTLAAGIALGNMSGGAMGELPHPSLRNRNVPNGEPDPTSPGLRLPAEVRYALLLGDGDSEPAETRARLWTGGAHLRAAGIEVEFCMAPEGKDFANLLEQFLVEGGEAAAA